MKNGNIETETQMNSDGRDTNRKKVNYRSYIKLLSPKDDLPVNDIYVELLRESLLMNETCNIALSGDYGSGKSSIIRSFLRWNKEKVKDNKLKCICISLANFRNEDVDKGILEKNILKQLFYKVDAKSIPNSRFSRIVDIKWREVSLGLLGIGVVISPLILYKAKKLLKNVLIKGVSLNVILLGVSGMLSFIVVTLIITKVMNKFKFNSIKSSKFIDIEMNNKQSENAFDTNIDEIIYLFQRNKYNVVFFEDIDRFKDSIKIFTSLRELNEILNDSEALPKYKYGRKLKFVYAIKDDVFFENSTKEKDIQVKNETIEESNMKWNYKYGLENSKIRTKFFDYIIPIIPTMDSINSYEYIEEIFKEYNSKNEEKIIISESLKADVSIFVDDVRLLRNTFNEFIIYYRKHGNTLIKQEGGYCDSLFALILYKNMYPVDFAKINKNDGDLYDIFKNKKEYVKEQVGKINEEIELLEKKIDVAKKEWLQSEKELWEIYKLQSNNFVYLNNGKRVNLSSLTVNDAKDIEKTNRRAGLIGDIVDRIEIIEDKKRINEMNLEIQKLKKERDEIQNATIKEILEKNIKTFDRAIKDKEILRILLRRGYISEDFEIYMSILKPGRMTMNDNIFLKLVTSKVEVKEITRDYKLDNPEYIISRINVNELSDEYSLNLDMLKFIIRNVGTGINKERMKRYIAQFEHINEYKATVITKYFRYDNIGFGQFISDIFIVNKSLFVEFIKIKSSERECINEVFRKIIDNSNIEYLEDEEDSYKDYILGDSKFVFLDVCKENYKKVEALIEKLDIKFKCLISDGTEINNEIIQWIYKENRYEITKDMIEFIIKMKTIERGNNHDNSFYTMYGNILNTNLNYLIDYINLPENINKYVKSIYIPTEYDEMDNKGVIELLNNENVDVDNKIEIISKKKFIIKTLKDIKLKHLFRTIMQTKKLETNWDNVEEYYASDNSKEELIKYLNDKDIVNSLSKMNMKEGEFQIEVQEYILSNKDISEDTIKILRKTFGKPFIGGKLFEEGILEDSRVKLLIQIGMIGLNKETYEFMKDNQNRVDLILKNIDKYLEEVKIYSVSKLELSSILKNITRDRQLKLLKIIDVNDIDMNISYKEIKRILEGVEGEEYNKFRSAVKKCEIEFLLLHSNKDKPREVLKNLTEISEKYKISREKKSFIVNSSDELYTFKEELEDLGFTIEYIDGGDMEISIPNKIKNEVAITKD